VTSSKSFGKTLVVIFALLAGLMIPVAAQAGPKEIVESWVASAKNFEAVSIRHGGVSLDEQSQITTISDFELVITITPETLSITGKIPKEQTGNRVSYKILVPELRIKRLLKDGNYFTADLIEAASYSLFFEVISSTDTITSKTKFDGMSISNAKWSQLPELKQDPSRPASRFFPLVAAMADFSFDSARTGAAVGIQTSQKSTQITTTKIGTTVYINAVRGNYASVTVSEMTITTQQAQGNRPPTSDVTIGQINATNYNIGTVIRSFDPAGWQADEKRPRPILEKMSIGKISINAGNATFSIDSIELDDIAVRPVASSALAALDGFLGQLASESGEPDPLTTLNMVSKFYSAFELGKQTIKGLKFNITDEADGKLESLFFGDVSSDGIGGFAAREFVFSDVTGVKGTVGFFGFKNLKFPSIKALINVETAQKDGDIAAMLRAIPVLEEITLKGFQVKIPGKGELVVGEETLVMGNYIGPIPTKLSLKITDLLVPVSLLNPKERETMTALGYDSIGMSWDLRVSWDEATSNLGLTTSATMNDGGRFDAKIDIGGIPRKVFENPLTAQSILPLITFKSASAKFNDNSIVNRVLRMMARQQGMETDVFRQQVIGAIPFALQKLNNADFIRAATNAVTRLLTSGDAISLTARPADPISLLGLAASIGAAPGAAVQMLNLQVGNGQ